MGGNPDHAWVCQLELMATGAREDASRWLAAATPDADPVLLRRLQLVVAIEDIREGHGAQGTATMHQVRQWALEHNATYLQARCARVLSVVLRQAGELTASLEHALSSVELLDEDASPSVHAEHLTGLADSLTVCGAPAQAIQRYAQALTFAERAGDQRTRILVVNNWTYTELMTGHLSEAVELASRLQALTASTGGPLPMYAVDTVSNVYLAVGRLAEASQALEQVVARKAVNPDELAGALLTLCTVQRAQGRLAMAQQTLNQCFVVCVEHDLGGVQVRALAEQAELHADLGDFRRAYEHYQAFHEQELVQHTLERQGRATMLHAIFETAEARRESLRLREMSYRDPLTGLRNRRYVDDHLSELLNTRLSAGEPVTVAFVDLDHFKRINDTCSHEVGDQVLCRVTAVLQERVNALDGGFVARMGGEEFLLVLPGLDDPTGHAFLDDVRRAVERIPWAGLTNALAVTASFGSATAPDDSLDRRALLSAADRRLYGAKHRGRNRVFSASSGVLPAQRHH